MRHQSPVCSRARSEYFYARAVHVQLHTRVFLNFKSSCTVQETPNLLTVPSSVIMKPPLLTSSTVATLDVTNLQRSIQI